VWVVEALGLLVGFVGGSSEPSGIVVRQPFADRFGHLDMIEYTHARIAPNVSLDRWRLNAFARVPRSGIKSQCSVFELRALLHTDGNAKRSVRDRGELSPHEVSWQAKLSDLLSSECA